MSGFLASLPGACAQGIIWGIMAVGVYLTFKVLDLADLTVDNHGTPKETAEEIIRRLAL